jgi:hypothetical protein
MDLVVEVYALAKKLPASENFRMVGQMTRSAVSVPANIAEGTRALHDCPGFDECVRGSIHTNGIENFWRLLERSIMTPTSVLIPSISTDI